MYIIKSIDKDFIKSYKPGENLAPICFLCKGNGCYGNPDKKNLPFYSFYHDMKNLVYFKHQWEAHMYLSYIGGDNNDIYIVDWRNPDEEERNSLEIFDPMLWKFVKPDEVQKGLTMYRFKTIELIDECEEIIEKYDSIYATVENIQHHLIRQYYERPEEFKRLWTKGTIFDVRRKELGKELFGRINELVYGKKEETKENEQKT